jgi:tRNA A-37 threonylcarbamoyl transferase component Bud32
MTRHVLPSRYASPELIAHGGMGEVYRATDELLGRTVAVKVLAERWATDPEFHERFLREARTAASLSPEPNVIVIYDVSETGEDLPVIVMEYATRGSLADRLRQGAVPAEEALPWLEQTARALDIAHSRRVVHRDVKPANLLLADDETIRVSDFGIARAAGQDTLTEPGSVLGSVGYMAPEQARGEPTSPASDRYALACVAFELLTGRRPFEREGPAAEATAHAHEEPPSVRDLEPRLPAAVDTVFTRGLAKQPEHRYPTCAAFVTDLGAALAATPSMATWVAAAPTVRTVHHSRRYPSRPRGALLLAGAAGVLAAGAAAAWGLNGGSTESSGSTVVLTRTVEGQERTVVVTETTEGATVERTVTQDRITEPAPAPAGDSGIALNDRGFRLLQAGDARSALPVLESAVAALHGSSSITEAYASYNLATARFTLGRCDGVVSLLDRSQQIQGHRKEIDRLRRQVERRCENVGDGDAER